MVETILHSGQFNDYDGNIITVTISKRTDLNAVPSSLVFTAAQGSKLVTVWSMTGEAAIDEPTVGWITLRQVSAVPLPGSNYWKYTYSVSVQANSTSSTRTTTLTVSILDGEGAGEVSLNIPVTQNRQ